MTSGEGATSEGRETTDGAVAAPTPSTRTTRGAALAYLTRPVSPTDETGELARRLDAATHNVGPESARRAPPGRTPASRGRARRIVEPHVLGQVFPVRREGSRARQRSSGVARPSRRSTSARPSAPRRAAIISSTAAWDGASRQTRWNVPPAASRALSEGDDGGGDVLHGHKVERGAGRGLDPEAGVPGPPSDGAPSRRNSKSRLDGSTTGRVGSAADHHARTKTRTSTPRAPPHGCASPSPPRASRARRCCGSSGPRRPRARRPFPSGGHTRNSSRAGPSGPDPRPGDWRGGRRGRRRGPRRKARASSGTKWSRPHSGSRCPRGSCARARGVDAGAGPARSPSTSVTWGAPGRERPPRARLRWPLRGAREDRHAPSRGEQSPRHRPPHEAGHAGDQRAPRVKGRRGGWARGSPLQDAPGARPAGPRHRSRSVRCRGGASTRGGATR